MASDRIKSDYEPLLFQHFTELIIKDPKTWEGFKVKLSKPLERHFGASIVYLPTETRLIIKRAINIYNSNKTLYYDEIKIIFFYFKNYGNLEIEKTYIIESLGENDILVKELFA